MAPTVYLISGANRGIGVLNTHNVDHTNTHVSSGLGLVIALARRDNVIVFAGARNPTVAEDLQSLVQQFPGKVHVVKLTSCDKTDNEAAVSAITTIAGRLDVVIACAGTLFFFVSSLFY
jgi:NAD(P)-dependent dehydrogenase (short-subunit alcohol dehydrogenase family)